MRKYFKNPDSMELLLDAMCNVFGAVLFAALLVGGVSIVRQQPDADQVPLQLIEQARLDNTLLDNELQTVQLECDILRKLPRNRPVAVSGDLQDKRSSYHAGVLKVNSLAEKIESTSARLRQMEYQALWLEKFAQDPQKTLSELEKASMHLQQKLARKTEKVITVHGIKTSDRLLPYRLIVTRNKVYAAGCDEDIFRKTPPDGVTISAFRRDGEEFYRVNTVPGKGFNIADFKLDMLNLPDDKAQKYFIELAVEDNAIAQAAAVLQEVRRSNMLHAWHTIKPGEAVWRTSERSSYEVAR